DLKCVEARVVTARSLEYGASIQLDRLTSPLFYSRKSGEFNAVIDALASAENQPVTLCYQPTSLAGLSEGMRHDADVFEVRSSHGMIRSLDQVRDSWRKDGRLLWVLIPTVLLGSTYLAFRAGTSSGRP
ncbi:MAG: hypothetical protein ACREO3_00290, partial [Arenimonas sp.]